MPSNSRGLSIKADGIRRYRDIGRSQSRGAIGELHSYRGMNKAATRNKAVVLLWHTIVLLGDLYCIKKKKFEFDHILLAFCKNTYPWYV